MAKKEKSKEEKTEMDALAKEINSFLKTNAKIEVESVGDHDFVPEFLDTGSFALNWAICGQLRGGGIPMTKCIEFYGDPGCLHEDTEIEISIEK